MNYFIHMNLKKKEKVIFENDTPDSIYIIKKGLFALTINKNLKELNDLINYMKEKGQSKEEELKEYIEIRKFLHNDKLLKEKKKFKVYKDHFS